MGQGFFGGDFVTVLQEMCVWGAGLRVLRHRDTALQSSVPPGHMETFRVVPYLWVKGKTFRVISLSDGFPRV